MTSLITWTPEDTLLGAVAPLALASARRTALVVDLDPDGPRYPGAGSLAGLVREGPRRADLTPRRTGIAVLRNGGVTVEGAHDVLHALDEGWPHVVFRLPPRPPPPHKPGLVPVHVLLPDLITGPTARPAVYQSAGWRVQLDAAAIVLPRPRRSTIEQLLEGVRPRRDRWLRAWRRVWEASWE